DISDERGRCQILSSSALQRRRHSHRFEVSANVLHHIARREGFAGFEGRTFLLTSAARNTRVQFDELPPLELLYARHADFAGLLDLFDRHWRKPPQTFYAGGQSHGPSNPVEEPGVREKCDHS